MANPSKQKGTGGETELVAAFRAAGLTANRTPPTTNYDVRVGKAGPDGGLDALATRPDYGQWLVTVRLADFIDLVKVAEGFYGIDELPVNVEVKRYARFALHAIWQKKFGKKQ